MSTIRCAISRLDYSPTSHGWLLLTWCAATQEDFELARSAVRNLPYQQRQWIAPARVWRVRASALLALSSIWPALREALAELGLSGEYGGSHGSYGRRYDAPPPPPMSPGREIAEAFTLLCLTPGAPIGLIQAARRYYAKALHPDHEGGDLEQMKRVNVAADRAEAYARRKLAA